LVGQDKKTLWVEMHVEITEKLVIEGGIGLGESHVEPNGSG
jgi:hypothetical protein